MKTTTTIALVGKVGHGKTFLLNKLTGNHFPSHAGASSCTRHVQFGYSITEKFLVVDTPGFFESDNLALHLAAQKVALEGHPLSGVYLVVKYGRADEIALEAARVMEFVGDDNIRIIITHCDTVSDDPGYDREALMARLSTLIGLPISNIKVVGKRTRAGAIEKFVSSTLHTPKDFYVSMEQTTAISSLCVCARRFDKAIRVVEAKIVAASVECNEKVATYGQTHEVDIAISVIQKTTSEAVQDAKDEIFRDAEDLPDDQKHAIYGKAGLALTLKLKLFVDATNKLLSWDVTDPSDARNAYKACPFCGAIFIKTEGCDGTTLCGAVPSSEISRERPGLDADFKKTDVGWKVQYLWNGYTRDFRNILNDLCNLGTVEYHQPSSKAVKAEKSGTTIESGCGASISWSNMTPIDPRALEALGAVELQREGASELKLKKNFTDQLKKFEKENRERFERFLSAIFG